MSFTYITSRRGKLSNDPYEITKKDIDFMLSENAHDEEECKRVTENSYKGENYYADNNANVFFIHLQKKFYIEIQKLPDLSCNIHMAQ